MSGLKFTSVELLLTDTPAKQLGVWDPRQIWLSGTRCNRRLLRSFPPPLFLWLTDLPSVLKIPGEQGCRDGDETASLTLSHCNPSLHRLPASICLQLALPNNPHCLSPPHPPSPQLLVQIPTPTHTHTRAQVPILYLSLSFFLPQLLSSSPGLGFQNQCSYQSPRQHCQVSPNHLSRSACLFVIPSLSISSQLLLPLPSSILCLLSYTCPNLFHLKSPPQWPCAN